MIEMWNGVTNEAYHSSAVVNYSYVNCRTTNTIAVLHLRSFPRVSLRLLAVMVVAVAVPDFDAVVVTSVVVVVVGAVVGVVVTVAVVVVVVAQSSICLQSLNFSI
jgi:hypothetical protein